MFNSYLQLELRRKTFGRQDIIKQWLILILWPMCTTDAGLSIISSPEALLSLFSAISVAD